MEWGWWRMDGWMGGQAVEREMGSGRMDGWANHINQEIFLVNLTIHLFIHNSFEHLHMPGMISYWDSMLLNIWDIESQSLISMSLGRDGLRGNTGECRSHTVYQWSEWQLMAAWPKMTAVDTGGRSRFKSYRQDLMTDSHPVLSLNLSWPLTRL